SGGAGSVGASAGGGASSGDSGNWARTIPAAARTPIRSRSGTTTERMVSTLVDVLEEPIAKRPGFGLAQRQHKVFNIPVRLDRAGQVVEPRRVGQVRQQGLFRRLLEGRTDPRETRPRAFFQEGVGS